MPNELDRDNRHGNSPGMDRTIEKLVADVEKLMKTKQPIITAAGNSIILARGIYDGELSELHRKDTIDCRKPDILNIPSEVAVVGFVEDHVQRMMRKVQRMIQQDDEKYSKYVSDERNRAIAAESELKAAISIINVDDLKGRIDAEARRAASAEAKIEGKLTTEINRANQEEGQLRTSIENEISRASEADGKLEHLITDETTRATAAEKTLGDRQTQFDNKILSVSNEVLTEKTRAESVEKAMDAKFGTYAENLQAGQSQLRGDLTAETSRAVSAEGAIGVRITEETNRAQAEERRIENKIDGYDSNVEEQIDALKVYVREQDSAECTRAQTQEGILSGRISDETARSVAEDQALRDSLASATVKAGTEASKLQNQITSEVLRSTNADKDINTRLDAEISRSTSRDDFLDGKISGETSRAVQVEDQLYHDIGREKGRAISAERDLDDKIKVNSSLIAAETDRSVNTDAKLRDDLTAETNRSQAKENSIASDLAAETARARSAEQVLGESLQAEIARASGFDVMLTDRLTNEINRATTSENQLNDEIVHERTRALSEEEKLRQAVAQTNFDKVDKTVAGVGEMITKNVHFTVEESTSGVKNAKQLTFHKLLLSLADGSTATSKEHYDLAHMSGAYDTGIALAAEAARAAEAERTIREQLVGAVSILRSEHVAREVFKSNGYKVLSSIDIHTEPDGYQSQFFTRSITKNVQTGEEIRNENHFRSDDMNFVPQVLDANDNLFDIKVNQATVADITAMLNDIFGA